MRNLNDLHKRIKSNEQCLRHPKLMTTIIATKMKGTTR